MKTSKLPLIIIVLIFLICSNLCLLSFIEPVAATERELFVDDNYSLYELGTVDHPYRSISNAIRAANPGDLIYVFGGLYNETLIIDKKITLIGGIEEGASIISVRKEHQYTVQITADFVTLKNFTIHDKERFITSQHGALVHVTANNVVLENNTFNSSAHWGVYLDSSHDNTLSRNTINGTKGVFVSSSNNNLFSTNSISNSSEAAIYLRSSLKNIIFQNQLKTSNFGVYARDCSQTNITQNIIMKNLFHGIYSTGNNNELINRNTFSYNEISSITMDSFDSVIADNTFNYGQIGINLQRTGSEVRSNSFQNMSIGVSAHAGSSNNVIFLNRFLRNTNNARDQGVNQWDDGARGNYWDDYNYIDGDKDMIGDIAYLIASTGKDRFPLGYFLHAPQKPINPTPADGKEGVGLKFTLKVKVVDVDTSIIPAVYFYNAMDNNLIGIARNIPSGSEATYNMILTFDTVLAWYVVVDDGLQQNQSDVWFFTTKQVPPGSKKPVANPGGPYSVQLGESIQFDGSLSTDPDGTIIFYRWDFGDGSNQILDQMPSHEYEKPGVYTVTLTVVDNDGRGGMANTTVLVATHLQTNTNPVAVIGATSSGVSGKPLMLDASNSYDIDGTIVEYYWDFGDGSYGSGMIINHTYAKPATYVLALTVMDNEGGIHQAFSAIIIESGSLRVFGLDVLWIFLIIFVIIVLIIVGVFVYRFFCNRNYDEHYDEYYEEFDGEDPDEDLGKEPKKERSDETDDESVEFSTDDESLEK